MRRAERVKVLRLLEGCRLLRQPARLWDEAGELGYFLGQRGATVKTLDLLIATYALSHAVPLLTADSDFATMQRAGVGLLLVAP
jgi:predicted nucleic acid-binding protein